MQFVIPAAGRGERLLPYTATLPKCLVPLGNDNALGRLLTQLETFPSSEVVIVVGHGSALVRSFIEARHSRIAIRLVENPRFADTNSIYSLWISLPYWSSDLCIIDSDLVLSDQLISRVACGSGPIVLIDRSKNYADIDMKVEIAGCRVRHFSKQLSEGVSAGEFFGVSRWNGTFQKAFMQAIDDLVRHGFHNSWYEDALNIIAPPAGIPFADAVESEWLEFDTPADLRLAVARLRKR